MDIDQIHELAIRINKNWDDLKSEKIRFINESDFFNMIESACLLAIASE